MEEMILILITSDREDLYLYMKIITDYVIENLCNDLVLTTVQGITIVDSEILPQDVDARTEDDFILISKSSIENCKLIIDKEELDNYLLNDISKMNDKFIFLIGNLYHELCHADVKHRMPNLHNIMYGDESSSMQMITAHYWVEFVAEYESHRTGLRTKDDFCISFVNAKWDIKYLKYNRNDYNDMFWLAYVSSYFIGLCYAMDKFDFYVEQISNIILKDLMIELYDMSLDIYQKLPFDDYPEIEDVEELFNKYWKKFILRSRQM